MFPLPGPPMCASKKPPPDVIFTDCSPGLDGLGLIQRMRMGDDTPNPVTLDEETP